MSRPGGQAAIASRTTQARTDIPRGRWWQRREAVLLLALLALIALVTAARRDFVSPANLRNILEDATPAAVAAAGMTALIVAGGIDISIGSIFAFCAVAAATMAKKGWPLPGVIGAAVLAGAVLGSLNGLLVARLGVPPIVATLASMGALRGFLVWWTEGATVNDLPPSFNVMSTERLLGLPYTVWAGALVVTAVALYLARTRSGRQCYAVGSSPRSAELSGLSVRGVTMRSFVSLGALVGFSAFLFASPFSFVQADAGFGFELVVITGVVVGGTNIFGGQGTVLGSVLGVLLLSVIRPALTFLQSSDSRLQAEWEPAVQGVLILAAVLWDSAARREAVRQEG